MSYLSDLLQRRACVSVTMTHKVNRFEIWLLSAFVGYLMATGRTQVSRNTFFQTVSGNPNAKRHMRGYWYGLTGKGCLIRSGSYNGRGDLYSVTPFGVQVLKAYERSYIKLAKRYKALNKKERKLTLSDLAYMPEMSQVA